MLRYPFRADVGTWLLGLVLGSVVIQFFTGAMRVRWLPYLDVWTAPEALAFGVIGMVLEVYWWLLAFKLAVQGLRDGAKGRQKHSTRDDWVDDAQALRQLLLWGGALAAGYVLYLRSGGSALAVYSLVLALLLPAVVVLLGTEDNLSFALDPRAWRLLFQRTRIDYLLAVAKLSALALLLFFVHVKLVPHDPRWLRVPLSRLAVLYGLFAGYYELGRMLDRNRRELTLAEPARVATPAELTQEEELALRCAERYCNEQRHARAARELEPLALRAGTSAQAHAKFREYLFRAGDEGGLLAHARSYVVELLAMGQDRDALALYEDSLTADPDFELAGPGPTARLFQVVLGERKDDLAIDVARQFLRRFPDEADAVPIGLSAARLLDRQGRDADARQLLIDLVRRFRVHPLRGELVAALETLESVARRSS
jgi:tetratricopeptide (TPR) repeat protein